MRGENYAESSPLAGSGGSSPHARGKLNLHTCGKITEGLIPACAGKTSRSSASCLACWAHPRMRGENFFDEAEMVVSEGSSPHARGKRCAHVVAVPHVGLIPACAGKTMRCISGPFPWWAHPRMRGENIVDGEVVGRKEGSSPHARGKQNVRENYERDVGLIPACAGKTCSMSGRWSSHRAHPRMRGENH